MEYLDLFVITRQSFNVGQSNWCIIYLNHCETKISPENVLLKTLNWDSQVVYLVW